MFHDAKSHGVVQYFFNSIVSEDRRLSGKVRPSGVFLTTFGVFFLGFAMFSHLR